MATGPTALGSYLAQVRLLPAELVERECGLIQIGRQHALAFDQGHQPSGCALQRVLAELRKLAQEKERVALGRPKSNDLDRIRAKREKRLSSG
jgi:hypothetical protein